MVNTLVLLEKDRQVYQRYPTLPQKVLISGSTGLIGSRISTLLYEAGHEVTRLVRHQHPSPKEIPWSCRSEGILREQFEGFDAVIHLAGKNIAERRWNPRIKEELVQSRCKSTEELVKILIHLKHPPKCLISASAVGIYGDGGSDSFTEEDSIGCGFLAHLCQKWEETTIPAREKGIRVINARFGVVLAKENGILGKQLPFFKLGLGTILGSGRQFISWIALDDVAYALYHLLMLDSLSGPFNITAPNPVTQEDFSRTVARILHRPCFLRLPAPLLRPLFGEAADEMLLVSTKALPKKLIKSGYRFMYPTLDEAVKAIILASS